MEEIRITIEDILYYAWSHALGEMYDAAERQDQEEVDYWDKVTDRIADVLYDLNPKWIEERPL